MSVTPCESGAGRGRTGETQEGGAGRQRRVNGIGVEEVVPPVRSKDAPLAVVLLEDFSVGHVDDQERC